jgi:asparagine synthase (glutamine-hydrolysing)
MCGIAGFQGRFSRGLLTAMGCAVAHRGPDGEGAWVSATGPDGGVTGLAHRRLAIIDLSSAGAQPMAPDCGACGAHDLAALALVFNGEIYNFRELRAELTGAGHRFRSGTDSEVLLHLYAAHGLAMVERLNGIFALAIRDGRERGRPEGVERGALVIARDQMGVKPLYLAETADGVLFASEMKAILQHPGVSRAVDVAALHQSLAYLWTPAPRTVLAGVRKLEPGTGVVVHGGRVVRRWSFYTQPYEGERDPRDDAALAAELAERLETAVDRQLVADVPVGAFLSGGLDSSAIVAMMRRLRPDQQVTCFTVRLGGADDGDNTADLPYARRVAAHLGVRLEEVDVAPNAILRLEEMVRLLDEPQADPAPINALLIAEHARALGIPVLLSGAGGDDLFGGYRRHWALQFESRWRWLPRAVRRPMQYAAQAAASGRFVGQRHTAVRRAAKMFAYAAEDGDRRLATYFQWSTEALRRDLYAPALADATRDLDTAEPLLASLARIPRERDPLQRMLFLEARHFLADHNLNYTDRAGMAAGVEVRVPLLDLDLVRFATRVPSSAKQRGRVGKAVFKQAMEPYLPRDVIYRPKTGFGAPLRRWLREELREMVADTLAPAALRQRGFFEPRAVERLIALDRSGAVDGSYTIFALMCLELWCRAFIDVVPRVPDEGPAAELPAPAATA